MNFIIIVMIAFNIFFNAVANTLIKVTMNGLKGQNLFSVAQIFSKLLLNPLFLVGCVSFALSLLCYSFVLQKINVNIAYPITVSGSILLITLISIVLLGEKIKWTQAAGVLVILTGITLVVR